MRWMEPAVEQIAAWQQWVAERPEHVRVIATRFDPWTLYRLTTTGQRCSLTGFHEGVKNCDETDVDPLRVTACIHAEHPVLGVMSARNVFGIDPDKLVPWTEADEPAQSLTSTFAEEQNNV